MRPRDVDAILRAEGSAPIAFPYSKDAYARLLLSYAVGGGRPLSTLRTGTFGRLLSKPSLRPALSRVSNGVLTPACLESAKPAREQTYFITLDRWGSDDEAEWGSSYYQMSRGGQNVVVQVAFPEAHDRNYLRLMRPGDDHPFVIEGHPARATEPFTLGWARLDVDPGSNEVLIEEVQTDWVRNAEAARVRAEEWLAEGGPYHLFPDPDLKANAADIFTYVEHVLRPHARVWQECVLAAAIWFAHERLGARRLYFHTWESGITMKRLEGRRLPPRSLYTELPRQFCFRETGRAPRALRGDPRLRRTPDLPWNLLEL